MREVFADEEFDCIYDISAYTTEDVASMVEILRGRTGHYVFASSTVIYAASRILPLTEDSPVDRSEWQSQYGLDKLACEAILLREHREHGFPGTIVPFSMVFGPNNIIPEREQRMFARLLLGRPVLIPGDGTTLGQIGHVDDEARALRMLMLRPETFGKRYNLTGRDYWSDEGYVDTFAEVVGVQPRKVFIPHATMDALYDGELLLETDGVERRQNMRTASSGLAGGQATLAHLQQVIQRLAPYIHRWNQSAVFSVDRLRRNTGWEPDYTFRGGGRADVRVVPSRGPVRGARVRLPVGGRVAGAARSELSPRGYDIPGSGGSSSVCCPGIHNCAQSECETPARVSSRMSPCTVI